MVPKILTAGCALLVRVNVPLDTSDKSPGMGEGKTRRPLASPQVSRTSLWECTATLPRYKASGKHVSTFLENYLFCTWHQPCLALSYARSVQPSQVCVYLGTRLPFLHRSRGDSGSQKARQEVPPGTGSHPGPCRTGVQCLGRGVELCPCPKFRGLGPSLQDLRM